MRREPTGLKENERDRNRKLEKRRKRREREKKREWERERVRGKGWEGARKREKQRTEKEKERAKGRKQTVTAETMPNLAGFMKRDWKIGREEDKNWSKRQMSPVKKKRKQNNWQECGIIGIMNWSKASLISFSWRSSYLSRNISLLGLLLSLSSLLGIN